jgi:hypothetical protein
MAKEYRTTTCKPFHLTAQFPDPIPPEGDGWRLCGSSTATDSTTRLMQFYWWWERDLAVTQSDEGEYLTQDLTFPQ